MSGQMDKNGVTFYILPAGRYYLGDPCYGFSPEDWDALCDQTDCFRSGPVVSYKGQEMVVFPTACGDGEYPDNPGNVYGVDSGLLAAVPVGLMSRDPIDGRVVDTEGQKLICHDDHGCINLGFGIIDTRPIYEDEDPEDAGY